MSNRKGTLSQKLSAETPAGWRDQVGKPEPESQPGPSVQSGTYKRKTYLLSPDMIGRIETIAQQHNVGINELVRYMLDQMVSAIEAGEHTLETQPVQKRTIVN